MADETCTQSYTKLEQNHDITIITLDCLAASDDADFLDVVLNNACVGKYLMYGEINPGATAPSADYGFKLLNAAGYDLAGGAFDNLSATVTERFLPIQNNVKMHVFFEEAPTVTWEDSNAVNDALTVIKLFFYQDGGSQA